MSIEQSSPYDLFATEQSPRIETVRFPGEAIVEQVHAEHPEIEERRYQVDCLDALSSARRNGKREALINVATGLGKTTVAAMDVKQFLSERPNSRVLFLAHRNEILKQARERFEYILGEEFSYGDFAGKRHRDQDTDFVFASFQLLHTSREVFEPDDFDYIVVDESHHGKAPTYEPTLRYFDPQFMLGMTATPDRQDLKEIREIFGKEVYTKSLSNALAEGLLARPDYKVFVDGIEERLLSSSEQLSIAQLNKSFFIPKRDDEIASVIKRKLESVENPRTIIFCPSIEYSERLQSLIDGSELVNSTMSRKERLARLDDFRSGKVNSVITVDLFNEGIDVADANAIVFLRSTQSETIFLQQLGRGLRKQPDKDSVLVLDFVANCDRLMMIEKLLHNAVRKGIRENLGNTAIKGANEVYDVNFTSIQDDAAKLNELDLGNFEFDETTRKVFEVIAKVKKAEAEIPYAPNGYVTVTAASNELGIDYATVRSIAKQLDWQMPLYRFTPGGTPALGISLSQFAVLREHPEVSTPRASDDEYSMNSLARELKVSDRIIKRMIEEQGFDLPLRKFGPKIAPAISRAIVNQLKDLYPDAFTPKVPEGWYSTKSAAEELGIDHATVKNIIEKEQWQLPRFKFGGGVVTGAISPEQFDTIRNHPDLLVPLANESVISVVGLARILKTNKGHVLDIAAELGIEPQYYRFGHGKRLGEGLTTPEAQQIQESPLVVEDAPDGWMNIRQVAEMLGIYQQVVSNYIKKQGWELRMYRSKVKSAQPSKMLSPEQINEFINDPRIQKIIEKRSANN